MAVSQILCPHIPTDKKVRSRIVTFSQRVTIADIINNLTFFLIAGAGRSIEYVDVELNDVLCIGELLVDGLILQIGSVEIILVSPI